MRKFPFFLLKLTVMLGVVSSLALSFTHSTYAAPLNGGTFTVNDLGDENVKDDTLTLREAILLSNGGTSPSGVNRTLSDGEKAQLNGCVFIGSAGSWSVWSSCGSGVTDTIAFNLVLTYRFVIAIESALPAITDPVIIDGYTQPGSLPNSSNKSFNGQLKVLLGGSKAGAVNGLTLLAGNSIIKGLGIYQFAGHGIQIGSKGGNIIEGNLILNSGADGIYVGAPGNAIGGDTLAARNLILANKFHGVEIAAGADQNYVRSNILGGPLNGNDGGNTLAGLVLRSSNNYVRSNIVMDNGSAGFIVLGGAGNRFEQNSIYRNANLGIDLKGDGVTTQGMPLVKSATSATKTVSGELTGSAGQTYTVEFYLNPKCDPSKYGEGKKYLGAVQVQTNANGVAKFKATVKRFKVNKSVVATATDPAGKTSEFSKCVTAQ